MYKIGQRIQTNKSNSMIRELWNKPGVIREIKPKTKYGPQNELLYIIDLDEPISNPITEIKSIGLEYHMIDK